MALWNDSKQETFFGGLKDLRLALDLDTNHNPRATYLSIKKLESGKFSADSHMIGVRKKMNGNIMSMIYW